MRKAEIEIQKARNLLENFEKLPATDIKNIIHFLMKSINLTLVSINHDLESFDRDFLVASENKIISQEMGNVYFFLKNLYSKDFKKSDRDKVLIKSWKNNVYLKKSYFKDIIDTVEKMVSSID